MQIGRGVFAGWLLPLCTLALSVAAVPARASLLYYDGFPTNGANSYVLGQLTSGTNPQHSSIVGFKDNAANTWQAGSTAVRISANSLVPPVDVKLTAQDGCFSIGEASGSPRAGYRNLVAPTLSGTTYYSFLMRYKGTFPSAFTHDYVAFDTFGYSGSTSATMDAFGTNGFVVAFVRQDASTVNLVIKTDTATQNLVANAAAGTSYLVAVKYVNNPGAAHEVRASVITQPQEPVSWTASITTPVRSKTINKMCVGGYGANSTVNCYLFDEVRIGTTFQDVAGVAGVDPAVFAGNTRVGDIAAGVDHASATFIGTLTSPGDPVADLYLYWGAADGGISDTATWANTGFVAQAAAATFSTNVTVLPVNSMVYYRLAAVTPSQKVWGIPEPAAFLTAPLTVASSETIEENALEPASFVVSRPDSDAACTAGLTVNYRLGGTAQPGVHYSVASTSSVTLAAGSRTASVIITPIPDFTSESDRSITLTVEAGAYVPSASASATLTIINVPLPEAPTNAFLGGSSSLASVAANWSLGRVPNESDTVLFSPAFSRRPLIWDAAAPRTVASWSQGATGTNAVFFGTTLVAPLHILGDADVDGGVWTHLGPSNAPAYALAVDIDGDWTVGAGAAINVGRDLEAVGIDPTGIARGFYRAGPGYLPGTGSSYGGESFTNVVTYGSVINPLSHGSGAQGAGGVAALLKYAGAGLVRIRVGGTATVLGRIAADGYGYANNGGGGSGGTLNLEAAKLVGTGWITANGGTDAYNGSGSGGRIRIQLTGTGSSMSDFAGTLTAYGAPGGAPSALYDTAGAAAGTIALQSPGMDSGAAQVVVRNHDNWRAMTNAVFQFNPSTHLPPKQDTDPSLRTTDWQLGDNAKVRLTKSVSVRSLEILRAVSPNAVNPVLYLDGFTLSVFSLSLTTDVPHAYPAGAYSSADFPPGWVVGNGSVLVQSAATLLLVR